MSQYFPKPYEPFGRNINVKVYLSNYATKADLVKTDVVKKDVYNAKIKKVSSFIHIKAHLQWTF